jgi:hypothetical protein
MFDVGIASTHQNTRHQMAITGGFIFIVSLREQ